jgi:HAD superfamily hydrolase (TIGR01450 family)
MLARILAQDPGRAPDVQAARAGIACDGLLIDLDGVVWLGGVPIDGAAAAVAALRARGIRVVFLTNDPSISREEQAARLGAMGIPATAEDVLTAAAATARFLAARGQLARRAFVVGSPAFGRELADAGLRLVGADEAVSADFVVVAGHTGFDYAELRAATRAVANGAQLIAAGRDRVVPTAEGPEPATGAILSAIEFATGASATVVGKPEPFMFQAARELLADCQRIAVVGDNLASDIAGAKRAGLEAALVLTGVSTERDLASAEYPPDFVAASLAELASSTAAWDPEE